MAVSWRCRVSKGGRNAQLNLHTRIEFTPDIQVRPHKPGAFMHTPQAPVSGPPFSIKKLRVHAPPVIPDSQPKLPFLVPDFHFDLPRLCVPEGVAHRLAAIR